eukprot:4959175-Prymnesium_polylepis.1
MPRSSTGCARAAGAGACAAISSRAWRAAVAAARCVVPVTGRGGATGGAEGGVTRVAAMVARILPGGARNVAVKE